MKQINSLLLLAILLGSLYSTAQVNCSFSATTATYVPVAGGTTPLLINRPYDNGHKSYSYDEGVANGIPIGFTFNYNGIDYDSINICANGFATLGNAFMSDTNTVENFYINSLHLGPLQFVNSNCPGDSTQELSGSTRPVLAPLWDDLTLQADSNLRYIATGVTGSRIFTIEWSHAYWQYDATSANLSFELKLYEGTNVIEFCYKDEGGTPNAGASASIGITGSNDIEGFMTLQNTSSSPTISTSTETDSLYKKPAGDQVYRFSPLTCKQPLNIHLNSYDNTSVNFFWQAPSGVTNFEYAVTTSADTPASSTPTTSTSQAISSLSPGIKYYIHVRSFCSSSSQSAWSAVPFTTTKNISMPPPITWQKSLGGSNVDGPGNILQTSDGGYIIAGSSTSNDGDVTGNHGSGDAWIVKLNSSGIIEWQKNYGGSDDEGASFIDTTLDGGYIFAGATYSNDGDVSGNHGVQDFWIVKITAAGTIQWQKCFGGSDYDIPTSIKHTQDSGFIVSGLTLSQDGDVTGNHGNVESWVIKINSSGSLEWQRALGGSADDYLYSISTTSDGGYITAGSSDSEDGDVSSNYPGSEGWIVKLNISGTIQWQKTFGGSTFDEVSSIEQIQDGGYILAAYSYSNDGDVTFHYGNSCYSDDWIVKLDTSGNMQWQKTLGGKGNEAAISVDQTSDGGYIIAGNSTYYVNLSAPYTDGDVNGNHGDQDYWIVKLDTNGDFQWQKNFGGTKYDYATSIKMTKDLGYIIGGTSYSLDGDVTGNHGNNDIWIVKLGPDALLPVTLLTLLGEIQGKQNLLHWTTATEQHNKGFEVERSSDGYNFSKIGFVKTKAINGSSTGKLYYDFTDAGYSSSTNYYRLKQLDRDGKFSYSNIVILRRENPGAGGLSIYPNPATNILNVKISSATANKATLLITDLAGKLLQNKVTQVGNGENIIQLNVSNLPAGTYFLKIICLNGCENGITKFIKQ